MLVDLCYAYKDDLVVVLAGYTDTMGDLFDANPGLASRFPHKFSFDDYGADDLLQIAQLMLRTAHFSLADEAAAEALQRLVAPIVLETPCGNARSVENRIAAAIAAQSTRLRAAMAVVDATATDASLSSEGVVTEGNALFQLTAADLDAACTLADRSAAVLRNSEDRS